MPGVNQLIDNVVKTTTSVLPTSSYDPLLSINKIVEYKRQNLFLLEIDGIDVISVFSTERPKLNLGEPIIYRYPNSYEKFQKGVGEWQPLNVVLNDIIAPNAAEKIFLMAKKQWDYLSAYSAYPSDYKMDEVRLKLVDPNSLVVESWYLHNVFFSGDIDWNANTLNYDQTDRLKISFQLTFNDAEYISGGY